MDYRRALGGLFVLAMGVASAVACGDTEPPDVPKYGDPGGLGKGPLPPNGDELTDGGGGGTGSSGSSSGGGGGSGSSSGSSSGGTATSEFACQTSGGSIVDGGTCSVSWSQTIFPGIQGTWGCAGASPCHGGTQVPVMSGTASQVYSTLANYTAINNLPYINPCSTEAAQSTFVCNTDTTTPCSILMPLNGTIPAAGLANLATWVACGAPQN